jgi:lysophospholipase L1-like esterase
MVDEVAASNPDIVVVAGGQNDMAEFTVNPDSVSAAIFGIFGALRMHLPDVRIIGIGPSVPGNVTATVIAFDADVQAALRAVGGDYVSLIAPTPVIQPEMLLPDRTHVDDAGHAAIAGRITDVLASS